MHINMRDFQFSMNMVPNAMNVNAFRFKIFFKFLSGIHYHTILILPTPYSISMHCRKFFIFFILQHYVCIHNKAWDTKAEIKFDVCKDVYRT